MKSYILCLLLFISSLQTIQAEEASSAVRLLTRDKQIVLRELAQPQLRQIIVELVRSSSLNSASNKYHVFTPAAVQQDYRDAVATGEYLIAIFSPARKIDTSGGEVTAAEVVIGLQRPDSKDSVFTIDESGRVVAHAKYSGEILLQLKKTVAEARPNPIH